MVAHHEPFKALGPVEWDAVPQDNLKSYLSDIFSDSQTIVESLPVPAAPPTAISASSSSSGSGSSGAGRARAKTESAAAAPKNLDRALSARLDGDAAAHAQKLLKEWKEVKVSPKENPLSINVYRLAAKDGKGTWFARRSVHHGVSFDRWRRALEHEFAETMKVQEGPGQGSIRGIGAEKRVEMIDVPETGKLQVFQLSAQFPGPTSPRDFITLLLTSSDGESPGKQAGRPLRQFVIVSKPCVHPECPQRQGFIRGTYESVEVIREIAVGKPSPVKRARSSIDLSQPAPAGDVHDALAKEAVLRATKKSGESGGPAGRKRDTSSASAPVDLTAAEGKDSAAGDGESEPETAIEWLMVTRSDPGGSVPRFMIEKGTPGGIVNDAAKFVKWLSSTDVERLVAGGSEEAEAAAAGGHDGEAGGREETTGAQSARENLPTGNLISARPDEKQHEQGLQQQQRSQTESMASSNGLYGMISGAFEAAAAAVSHRLPNPFGGSVTGTASDFDTDEERTQVALEDDDDDSDSDTSSIHSFASAMDGTTVSDHTSPLPDLTKSTSGTSTAGQSSTIGVAGAAGAAAGLGVPAEDNVATAQPDDKELRKLEEKRRKIRERAARMQERLAARGAGAGAGTAADKELAKLREKHEREMAKHEDKYRRELEKMEARRRADEKKARDKARKQAEREEKANLALELEKVRNERDVARRQLEILRGQVGELQAQNTMLVAKLGRAGVKVDGSNAETVSL